MDNQLTVQHKELWSTLCGSLDWGGEFWGGWIHVYMWLNPFIVHLKLSQHCKSSIPQYKISFIFLNYDGQPNARLTDGFGELIIDGLCSLGKWQGRGWGGKMGSFVKWLISNSFETWYKKRERALNKTPSCPEGGEAQLLRAGRAHTEVGLLVPGQGRRMSTWLVDLRKWGLHVECYVIS